MGCGSSKHPFPDTIVKPPEPETSPQRQLQPATTTTRTPNPHNNNGGGGGGGSPGDRFTGPPIVLPGQASFHPSANGRNGYEFSSLYHRTEEQLDGGNFGAIFQCHHLHRNNDNTNNTSSSTTNDDNNEYWKANLAVKVTHPNALDTLGGPITTYDEIEKRCQEIRTLLVLQKAPISPHILRLQEFFYNRNTKELKVVTELLQMNLRDWIDTQRQFTESQGRTVAKLLVGAMKFMHRRNIIHRDIKEANVVFQKTGDLRTLKLVDFGLAKVLMPNQKEKAFCGSMGYIAPEIYMRENYCHKVDLFSFGVLMFKILSGKRPWPAGPQELTARKTMNLEYKIVADQWVGVSVFGRDFIRKLLVFEEERMDSDEAEQHEWLHEDTRSVLRTEIIDHSSQHNTPSDAVINPEGASQNQQSQQSRESTTTGRFWVEANVVDALQTFIAMDAFRGAIIFDSTTSQQQRQQQQQQHQGLFLVEERLPENAERLPYFIINLQTYTERECRNVCREIAKCIQLFHNGNIVHRKLHMENVVVEGMPGSADFNVSLRGVQYCQLIREDEPLTGRVGRQLKGWQAFIAPEIQTEFYHDRRVDLWSLGAIIYMSLCGTAPDKPENYFMINRPSDMAADLVLKLLQQNPNDRISIDEVLQHPWMTAPDSRLAQEGLDLAKILYEDYGRSARP